MKVKVCGMTNIDQLRALETLEVDFVGLIFYEKSARFVGNQLNEYKDEIAALKCKRVGVFVNESVENIIDRTKDYSLDYVQLHGDESVEDCKTLQKTVPVIKAVRISEATNLDLQIKKYEGVCDYFLFDTDSKHYGGTGKQFDWSLLQSVEINKPFFLSGGIGLDDLEQLNGFTHKNLFAVDVNSKFEMEPGVKDLQKVEAFLKGLRQYDNQRTNAI